VRRYSAERGWVQAAARFRMPDRTLHRRYTVALLLRPTPYNRRGPIFDHDMTPTHIHTRRTVALAALGCAVLLASCGSSSSKHLASASHGVSQGVKYADCVRSHGVPNFPDLGTRAAYHFLAQVNPSAPAIESAQKACAKYGNALAPPEPPSESQMRELLKFSQCMRTHRVSTFPDPTGNNVETEQLIARLGIDPRSPAFQHAAAACGDPGLWHNGVP
jgi:hypothetical protein